MDFADFTTFYCRNIILYIHTQRKGREKNKLKQKKHSKLKIERTTVTVTIAQLVMDLMPCVTFQVDS